MKEFPRGPSSFRLAEEIDPRMNPTRRDFLKLTTIGGAAAAVFGFDLKPAFAQLRVLKIARASETRSTCPYCAVGCGTIIYTIGDRAKNVTDRKSTRLNSSHRCISYAVFCLKKKTHNND